MKLDHFEPFGSDHFELCGFEFKCQVLTLKCLIEAEFVAQVLSCVGVTVQVEIALKQEAAWHGLTCIELVPLANQP
eukprot:747290-Pelagomonas_calceolata.AAC.3